MNFNLPKLVKVAFTVVLLMVYPFVLGEIGLPSFTVQAFDDIPELGEIAFHQKTADNLALYFESGTDDWKMEQERSSRPVAPERPSVPEPLSESQPLAARHPAEEPVVNVTIEPSTEPPPPLKIENPLAAAPVEEISAEEPGMSIDYAEATALARKTVWPNERAELSNSERATKVRAPGFDMKPALHFDIDSISPGKPAGTEEGSTIR